MGLRGISVGACIGSLFGPFGAVLGAMAGEYFERHRERGRKSRAGTRNPQSPLDRHYKVLGAKPGESKEAIKRRYRDLVKTCHPDVLRARGAGEAEIERATERMIAINAAWAAIENR